MNIPFHLKMIGFWEELKLFLIWLRMNTWLTYDFIVFYKKHLQFVKPSHIFVVNIPCLNTSVCKQHVNFSGAEGAD